MKKLFQTEMYLRSRLLTIKENKSSLSHRRVEMIERRKFLKMSLLIISSIYLNPKLVFQVEGREPPNGIRFDKNDFKFRGRYQEQINNSMVLLPGGFIPALIGKEIHLAEVNNCCLTLIPEDKYNKERIEKEIEELKMIEPETHIFYLGATRLKRGGRLFISQNERKLASLKTSEVVIIGMGNSIEIWDEKSWEMEIKKYLN